MNLKLSEDWWQEIERLACSCVAKDQLKAMVGAWRTCSIPPLATTHILRELRASGITTIESVGHDDKHSLLEIAEFVPDNKETGRSFTFLRPVYPRGKAHGLLAGSLYGALDTKGPGQAPGFTYPMEIFINGELSFKLDTEDAEGDLAAIKALMTMRTAKRQNRPLTNMELYGTDLGIGDVVHRAAHGKLRAGTSRVAPLVPIMATVTQVLSGSDSDCTFKQGDKDPCPTCPKLITALHRCGLLQDEIGEAEETLRPEGGDQD